MQGNEKSRPRQRERPLRDAPRGIRLPGHLRRRRYGQGGHGNARVRKDGLVGQTVSFDLKGARITVADSNGDGATDLDDVQIGDKVVVKAMLPKSDPGARRSRPGT